MRIQYTRNQLMRTLQLLVLFVVVGAAHPAFAQWTFDQPPYDECAPPAAQDLGERTPQALIMLDRSGSMSSAGATNTCKACESNGTRRVVTSASECPTGGTAWTVTDSRNAPAGVSGYSYGFIMATPPSTGDITVRLGFRGDFDANNEVASITIDGSFYGTYRKGVACGGGPGYVSFQLPPSVAADGQVRIDITTTTQVGVCPGALSESSVTVDITHHPNTYLGTITNTNPCGASTRWQEAVRAIDLVTAESDASTPQYAHFGLATFSTGAVLNVDCAATNRVPISNYLTSTSPSGNTATASAIATAYASACVSSPPTTATPTKSADVGDNNSRNGYSMLFTFNGVPSGQPIPVAIDLRGDYNGPCEFAAVYVDGAYLGTIAGTDCGQVTHNLTIPAAYAADGVLDVEIIARGTGTATSAPSPMCAVGADGVQNGCVGTNKNGATVRITHPIEPRPTTVIMITDGAPTVGANGVTCTGGGGGCEPAQRDAVAAACANRSTAPMFVVGLGGGTDIGFNNVLAAASGTGSCADMAGNTYDPCVNPAAWATLTGLCSGSIQANNGDDLLRALQTITSQLACTFDISFFNSGVDSVPLDASSEYAYLLVKLGSTRVHHADWAGNPTPGEGWRFTSDARTHVAFSSGYCANIQAYQYPVGSTQLACLCNQDIVGQPCMVPDNVALGVCPDGVWACSYGTAYCMPEANCCEPGPCDTGLEGICAAGTIVCDGSPLGTCVPHNEPQPEICDGLDNDCDGEVDEGLGGEECARDGGVGRCGEGRTECVNGRFSCVPARAMPELCNGLDDDCDGEIDNMSTSWSKIAFASIRSGLSNNGKAAACNFNDVCMCPKGPAAGHSGNTFDEYLAAWAPPVCACGEGLAGSDDDGPMSTGEPSRVSTGSPSACSTSGGTSGTLAALFVFAVLGWRRRR